MLTTPENNNARLRELCSQRLAPRRIILASNRGPIEYHLTEDGQLEVDIRVEAGLTKHAKGLDFEVRRFLKAGTLWHDTYDVETLSVEGAMRTIIDIPAWNGHLEMVGTPDRVIRYEGKIWHQQHRTLAQGVPREAYNESMTRDMHETLYARMIQEKYPDEAYGGTFMDVLVKTSFVRFDANPAAFMYQDPVPINQQEIEWGVDNITRWCTQMRMMLAGELPIPDNPKLDLGPFRNSKSLYFDVLKGDMDHLADDRFFKDMEDRYPVIEEAK